MDKNMNFVYRVQEIKRAYPELSTDEAEEMAMALRWEFDDPLVDALMKTNPLEDLINIIRQRDMWYRKYRAMRFGFWALLAMVVVLSVVVFSELQKAGQI